MELVGLIGFAAFTLTSFAVGFRLLWLGSRTRQVPELAIGGSFVLAGGIGGVLSLLADSGRVADGSDPAGILAALSASIASGVVLLAVFTWRVFRPNEGWGAALFLTVVAGLVLGHVGKEVTVGFGVRAPGFFDWLALGSRITVYTWAAIEALREHLAARRRCSIGLADPLVANRFLLWAIGLGAVLIIWLHSGYTMLAGTIQTTSFLLIAALGFLCAGALWLAFFPPAFYRRRFALAREA